MRGAIAVAMLGALAGCGEAGSSARACGGAGCSASASGLLLAAELVPPAGAPFARQEFPSVGFDEAGRATLALSPPSPLVGTLRTMDVDACAAGATPPCPVPARLVFTRASAIDGRPDVTIETATDDKGAFPTVWLPPGPHKLRVLPQGSAEQALPPLTLSLAVPDGGGSLDLMLESGTALWGQVTSALGDGVPGVRVRAVDPRSGDLLSSVATSDATAGRLGAFVIRLSPDAAALPEVRILADGPTLPVQLSRDIAATAIPKALQAPFVLRAAALPTPLPFTLPVQGLSTSGAMVPVAGALVAFEFSAAAPLATGDGAATTATFSATATSDGEGNVAAPLIPGTDGNRPYQVTVTPPAGSMFSAGTFSIDVPPASPACTGAAGCFLGAVTLAARPGAGGRLLDSGGAPVGGVVVSPELEGGDGSGRQVDLPDATTTSDGRFLVRVEPGVYDFDLVPPPAAGLPRWSIDGRRVDAGDVVDLGDIALPPAAAATLTVVGPSGAGVAGVQVRLYAVAAGDGCPADRPGCPVSAHLRGDGATAADGTLALRLAAPSP